MSLIRRNNNSSHRETNRETNRQPLKLRNSVENVKQALRKEFRDRLKQLRNEILNGQRNLTADTANLQILKNNICVEAVGLTSANVMQILEEVESELKQELVASEGDQYEQDHNAVIEDFLRGMNVCPVCDRIINQNVEDNVTNNICDQCSESFDVI